MLNVPRVFVPYFFEETHRYANENGVVLPGVTSILSMLSASFYGRLDKNVLAHAAEVGHAVHACIEYAIAGELDESSIDEEWLPYYEAWTLWRNEFKPSFKYTEKKLGCDFFCGTVDCVAELDGNLYVIDWKTTSKLMKSVSLQTAAYELLVRQWIQQEENRRVPLLRRAALQLKDNGKFNFEVFDDIEDYRRFANCLELYQWVD